MDPGQEKRRDPRVPLVLRVDSLGNGDTVRGTTENLSAGGLFVRTDLAAEAGDRLPLQISFPGLLAPVTVEVEVVWRRPGSDKEPGGLAVRVPDDRIEDRRVLARLAETARHAAPAKRSFRILVVEDNRHVVEMYEYALKKLRAPDGSIDVAVDYAGNGHDALERLSHAPAVDLVVADLYMPVMDGFALVERMRARPDLLGTPVLAISAGGPEARERALQIGVDVYLQKPVQFADIIGTVRTLLHLQR
jgi:uncharacterized protein (TIGR02266 family)